VLSAERRRRRGLRTTQQESRFQSRSDQRPTICIGEQQSGIHPSLDAARGRRQEPANEYMRNGPRATMALVAQSVLSIARGRGSPGRIWAIGI